jgi:hypothetical protein
MAVSITISVEWIGSSVSHGGEFLGASGATAGHGLSKMDTLVSRARARLPYLSPAFGFGPVLAPRPQALPMSAGALVHSIIYVVADAQHF